jgi:4-carboxymuconolactone decarboxylase
MPEGRPQLREQVKSIVPTLVDYTDKILLGEIWERESLSKRDRSLITIAALIATYRPEALADHLLRGRANGLTDGEISEMITHLAFYAGWPAAMAAARVALEVFNAPAPDES